MRHTFGIKAISGTMCLVLTIAAIPIATYAGAPYGLGDLIDIRASSGEDELRSRGYHLEDSDISGDSKFTTWWNGEDRQCVMVETYDGRYKNLQSVEPSNCNQERQSNNSRNEYDRYRNGYNNYDNHNNDHKSSSAVGAVAAALAIGAVVAAAVSSNKNKNSDHSGTYSPSNDITCYRSTRSCYGPYNNEYNGYWTNREFPRY